MIVADHTAVKLPKKNRQLYLVALFSPKYEKPSMLITTMKVFTLSQAGDIITYYIKH
jgi:hypothetical protein